MSAFILILLVIIVSLFYIYQWKHKEYNLDT